MRACPAPWSPANLGSATVERDEHGHIPDMHRILRTLLFTIAITAPRAHAQQTPHDSTRGTIPYFPLAASPIRLTGDARPGMFVSAVGRRAIAMGTEDGRLELWSWPIKWLHDLELSFQVPKYVEPIQGHAIARRVVERPEGVTIEYAYEAFTVRQHIFVPLDEPAVIMLRSEERRVGKEC